MQMSQITYYIMYLKIFVCLYETKFDAVVAKKPFRTGDFGIRHAPQGPRVSTVRRKLPTRSMKLRDFQHNGRWGSVGDLLAV